MDYDDGRHTEPGSWHRWLYTATENDCRSHATAAIGATAFLFLLTPISVAGIIGGIGLLKRRSWARILLLIVSVLQLLDIPLGTALGIYTIWVLIQDETKNLLEPGPAAA